MKFLFYLTFFILLNLKADELTSSKLDIKFFGTLGGVYNDNSDYTFTRGAHSKDGSSNDLNTYIDSILGFQTSYEFNDNLSVIAQGIVNKNDKGNIKAKLNSAYLKYDSNENIIFKIGRIKLPYYRNSNNNNVGYSKLMIREPIEVYGQMPLDTYNGVEFIYSNIISKYFYTIQGNYGQEKFDVPIQTIDKVFENELKDIKALNITFGNDIVEARASYLYGKISTDNALLDSIFSSLSSQLAKKYEMKDKKAQYFGLGLFVDYNNFIFSSEYGKRKVDSFYLDTHGFYTTLGYRYGSFIPYISYAKVMMNKDTSVNTGNPRLNYLIEIQNVEQSSNTIGFKYNINKNMDFKFEYQRIKPIGDHGGFNLEAKDPYNSSNSNVYSFVIDFVF